MTGVPLREIDRAARGCGILLVALLVAGTPLLASPRSEARRWHNLVSSRGLDPSAVDDPTAYTEQMQKTALAIAGAGSPLERLRRLQREMFDERRFPYQANSAATYTAIEAFERRTGNCVSFTNLFIAMSRSLGLTVRPALISLGREKAGQDETIIVSNHVVALFEHSAGVSVFDFNRRDERLPVGLRIIDDADLAAVYLNNLGAEDLLLGDNDEAMRRFELASRLAPDFAPALANLGLARKRSGDADGALEAYRAALEIDPTDPATLTNLAALFLSLARPDEAREAMLAADLRGAPHSLLVVRGHIELSRDRPRRALALYRRAAHLAPDRVEPLWAIARVELDRGRERRAAHALSKILEIRPHDAAARRALARVSDGVDAR